MGIPNKNSFFLLVTKKGINIFSSRDETYKRQVDSLYIRYIKPIPEDKYLKGGVHNLGTFHAGHCFEIKATIPNGQGPDSSKRQKVTWVFCLEDQKEKQKLMKIIIKLKLMHQRKTGSFHTNESVKTAGKKKTLAHALAKKNAPKDGRKPAKGPPQDGYWLLLQDWSPCSKKCGGGESWQQWQCVPPKHGGKKCVGKSIRKKKCNTSKCPHPDTVKKMHHHAKTKIQKPIVQIAPFSNRLQRYEKCVLKEVDAHITTFNEKKASKEKKIPVRVVMNNSTLTIFKDDKYTNIYHSFDLEKTNLMIVKNHFCCVNIKDSFKSTNLCGYEKFCGKPKDNKWAHDWSDHFKLFKVACRVGRMESLISSDDEAKLAE